ncbi:hypothetical protein C0995_003543 [Termitomyces sp. Mi166|nr:hypothetical protein C0995_003543 [Termitomyces sp. Mi166\
MYSNTKEGNTDGNVFMKEANFMNPQSQIGNPTYYGPIPIYARPFAEQVGGKTHTTELDMPETPSSGSWTLCECIPLTFQGSNNLETHNFAHCHAEMTPSPFFYSEVEELLDGLNDSVIASLAYDKSSSFSSLEAKFSSGSPTAEGAEGETLTHGKDLDPVGAAASVDKEKPMKHSLLKKFDIAGEYEDIVLPLELTGAKASCTSTASPTLSSNNVLDPFIQEPMITGNASVESSLPNSNTAPAPCTPPLQSSAQKYFPSTNGHPSHAALKQCQKSFAHIKEIFTDLTQLQWPPSQIKKWFFTTKKKHINSAFDTSKSIAQNLRNFHVVAEKIAEKVNMEQLIDELNKAMDSLEAELKSSAGLATAGEQDVIKNEDLAMKEDMNMILSCKKYFIALLRESATEAVGQWWSGDQLPWATLPNHLINISHKLIIINVKSKDKQDIEQPPPLKKNKSKKSTTCSVYIISSNSKESTQPPFKDIPTNSVADHNSQTDATAKKPLSSNPPMQQPHVMKKCLTIKIESNPSKSEEEDQQAIKGRGSHAKAKSNGKAKELTQTTIAKLAEPISAPSPAAAALPSKQTMVATAAPPKSTTAAPSKPTVVAGLPSARHQHSTHPLSSRNSQAPPVPSSSESQGVLHHSQTRQDIVNSFQGSKNSFTACSN